jgi:hypothetical protein
VMFTLIVFYVSFFWRFDVSLQKKRCCGRRFGWSISRTLS